ncbi:MAG: hypothetical protein HZA62_14400 [Rhodocyclales bacterium]|nr:hypothetical protein [Rhodocyclales bacterium]
MLKTKKLLPKKLAANQVVVAMQEAAVNVLSANMNVLYVARDQGKKVWVALGATAGDLAAQNLRRLKDSVAAANDKSVAAWDAVEQALDARVMPVLDKVGLAAPAQYGVDLLGKGLHRVSAQVVELTRERRLAAKRVVRKPAAKKVVARRRARPAVKLAA